MSNDFFKMRGIVKQYQMGNEVQTILKGIDLDIEEGVVHHMIGVADPGEDFSVGKYVELAEPVLQDILSRGKTCVVCGGTGLYADSLLLGRSFAPCPSTGMRETLFFLQPLSLM